MRKTYSLSLTVLIFSLVLILASGCFRPAAPDVTPASGESEVAGPSEIPDLEGTAIANSTQAAATISAQTAEAEPGGEDEEPDGEGEEPSDTPPPATATTEPSSMVPTATPMPTTAATTAPPAQPTATPAPSDGTTTYVVQAGDNLFRIALRYGLSVQAIAQANGIVDPTEIYVGQVLTIPSGAAQQPSPPSTGGTTHVVQAGENLFRIALRYNTTYQRLAAYNGIQDPSDIYVGQVLQIPPQ